MIIIKERLPRKKKRGTPLHPIAINVFFFFVSLILCSFFIKHNIFVVSKDNIKKEVEVISEYKEEYFIKEESFRLIQIEGSYLGRGLLEGKGYYVFQTIKENILSDLYLLPTSTTTVVTNANKNELLVSVKIYPDYLNKKDIISYTIFLKENHIRDYGIIGQKELNQKILIPFFFFY